METNYGQSQNYAGDEDNYSNEIPSTSFAPMECQSKYTEQLRNMQFQGIEQSARSPPMPAPSMQYNMQSNPSMFPQNHGLQNPAFSNILNEFPELSNNPLLLGVLKQLEIVATANKAGGIGGVQPQIPMSEKPAGIGMPQYNSQIPQSYGGYPGYATQNQYYPQPPPVNQYNQFYQTNQASLDSYKAPEVNSDFTGPQLPNLESLLLNQTAMKQAPVQNDPMLNFSSNLPQFKSEFTKQTYMQGYASQGTSPSEYANMSGYKVNKQRSNYAENEPSMHYNPLASQADDILQETMDDVKSHLNDLSMQMENEHELSMHMNSAKQTKRSPGNYELPAQSSWQMNFEAPEFPQPNFQNPSRFNQNFIQNQFNNLNQMKQVEKPNFVNHKNQWNQLLMQDLLNEETPKNDTFNPAQNKSQKPTLIQQHQMKQEVQAQTNQNKANPGVLQFNFSADER